MQSLRVAWQTRPTITSLNRRRLLALAPAALIASAIRLPVAEPALAGKEALPPAVQSRLIDAMREAIVEARLARYPFGAVLLDVDSGETVYRAHNVTTTGDPSAHAEIAAIRGAGLQGIDLTRTVLVGTAECCSMCASCATWAGVAGAVYGTSIPAVVGFGWQQIPIRQQDIVNQTDFNKMPVIGGVLSQETDLLYAAGPPA